MTPLTCPPMSAMDFDPGLLRGNDLVYFDLHGNPGGKAWFGDHRVPALGIGQIKAADLTGAVVFALTCFLGDQESPMLDALLQAGASYVIAGTGENWSDEDSARYGGAALAKVFRFGYRLGLPVMACLKMAKIKLRMDLKCDKAAGKSGLVKAGKDALEMKAYVRKVETL